MAPKNVKGTFNDMQWSSLAEYTRPNGTFEKKKSHQTFVPKELPPQITYDQELIILLSKAERKLGELKGKGDGLKDSHILIHSYMNREAIQSSKIEGILASLDDLNRRETLGAINKKDAKYLRINEVVNYVNALKDALDTLKDSKKSINLKLLKKAHKTLMRDVRGQDENPGKFRTKQNHIIKRQARKSTIIYTPPSPDRILHLLKNLIKFIDKDHPYIPVLVQCAIIHYQFEAIHPFDDGNCRIGRLLLMLVLYKKGLLPVPLLYLSGFFERNREEYYDGLLKVSQKSRWNKWTKFFLQAVVTQADESIAGIQRLTDLKINYNKMLRERRASTNAQCLMECLFANPYVTIPAAAKFLKVSYPAAKNAVMRLVEAKILKQTKIIHSSSVFVAPKIKDAPDAETA